MTPLERRLNHLHDRFLYIALMLGYFAVVAGGAAPLWLLVGFPVGLVAAHYFYRAGLAKDGHNRWWNAIIGIALLYTAIEYLINPLAQVMLSAVRFSLVLTLIKCFSRQGPRDELQIYALSFLTMAAASEIHEDLLYGILFGLYVLSGTFSLALFHLKTEASRHRISTTRGQSPFDRFYVSTLAVISVLIFVCSIVIFFAFPRVGLGLFNDPTRSGLNITGFADEVEVGEHGTLRDNPTVAMRVEFDEDPPAGYESFLWRVRSFDHYDGRGWSRTRQNTRSSAPFSHARNYDLDFLYTSGLRERFDDNTETLDIFLEPLGTSAIPTLWPTSGLRMRDADSSPLFSFTEPELDYDDYGDVHHDLAEDVALTYTIEVQSKPPLDALRRQSGRQLNPDDAERYLQTPDTLAPAVTELAEDLTADADSHHEKAEAIGAHFIAEFDYTLELPEIEGDDPVSEFLFDHREGHCEYFATSAAMLLREAGVPTRLVNGFLGGTYNDIGDYLTVRQGDAHAWLEIFVPELGWVPFDPTPPIHSAFLDRSRLYQAASDAVDAARHVWVVWFLDYDLDTQLSLFRDIGQRMRPAGIGGDESDDTDTDDDAPVLPLRALLFWGGLIVLVGLTFLRSRSHPDVRHWRFSTGLIVTVGAAIVWTGLFQNWSPPWMATAALATLAAGLLPVYRRLQATPDDLRAASRLFRTIERTAARRDLARRPDEGPAEFLDRLGATTAVDTSHLQAFRSLYLDVRFGDHHLTDDDLSRLRVAARAITNALRDTR